MDGFESAWGNYKAIQTLNIITTDGVEAEISAVPPMNPTQFCVAPVLYRSARRGSEHSPFLGTIALPSVIREGEEEGVPGAEVERARPIPKRKPLSSFSIPTLGSSFAASSEYTRVSQIVLSLDSSGPASSWKEIDE